MGATIICSQVGFTMTPMYLDGPEQSTSLRWDFIKLMGHQPEIVHRSGAVADKLDKDPLVKLVLCELGDALEHQNPPPSHAAEKPPFKRALDYIAEFGAKTLGKKIPLVVTGDADTLNHRDIRAACEKDASYVICKGEVNRDRYSDLLRRWLEVGINPKAVPYVRVTNFSDEFHVAAREEARRINNSTRVYFIENSTVKVRSRVNGYQVTYGRRGGDEWLDFVPENSYRLVGLQYGITAWNKNAAKRRDSKVQKYELLTGNGNLRK